MPEHDDKKTNVNTTAILNDLFGTLQSFKREAPDPTDDLLRERARQYAAADDDTPSPSTVDSLTVLTFTIGAERFGIDVMMVSGVRPLPPVVRVPGTPNFYRGVMNVRGNVVTQWDLLAFLGTDKTRDARELVVLTHREFTLGVPVTHVHGVEGIPKRALRNVEEMRYAIGVYTEDGINTLILDAHKLFTDERLMGSNRDES